MTLCNTGIPAILRKKSFGFKVFALKQIKTKQNMQARNKRNQKTTTNLHNKQNPKQQKHPNNL